MSSTTNLMSSEVYHKNETEGEHKDLCSTLAGMGSPQQPRLGPPSCPGTDGRFAKSIMRGKWPHRNTVLPHRA